ncbi:MAG: hypothetical protein JWO67_3089 [Streptosporangiaceae bacterium]|jgi:hypothetical protein|nr:hypothetical protein [Streptosporangiaceae bacterium]
MNAISLSQVSKSFGPVQAVRGLDLTIAAGQAVARGSSAPCCRAARSPTA